MGRGWRVPIVGGVLLAAVAAGAWVGWRAWENALPPPVAAARAQSEAIDLLARGAAAAVPVPPADMRYPRWRMEVRRLLADRGRHVRTWLVAARVTGRLEGAPASAAPRTADVWVIAVERYCRDGGDGGGYLGPGQPPPVPPGAVCWTALVYHGGTGREWWGVATGP